MSEYKAIMVSTLGGERKEISARQDQTLRDIAQQHGFDLDNHKVDAVNAEGVDVSDISPDSQVDGYTELIFVPRVKGGC